MKRLLAVILTVIMLFSVCSCEIGKKPTSDSDGQSTEFDGNKPVVSTENFSISFAELDYIFCETYNSMIYSYYSNFQSEYANYILTYTGLDINKSLKEQTMTDGSGTFFDYFVTSSIEKATDLLIFCEYAKANSIEFSDEDREYIEEMVDTYVQNAAANECTLSELFEDSMNLITEDVLRSYAEKNTLAGLGYRHLQDTYNLTDEEIDTEFNSNLKAYSYISYLVYTFQTDDESGISAEDIKKYADELSKTASTDDFTSYCKNYHDNVLYKGMDSHPEFSADNLLKERIAYSEGTDYLDKLFEGKNGDTFITESTGEDITTYSVYMLTSQPAETTYSKVNVRHILFKPGNYDSNDACKKAAEDVYALYKQNPTEDNFAALADKYSEDTYIAEDGSQKLNSEGGLLENIGFNETAKDFENWIFASDRKAGDTSIILSTVGYHVMYFSAFGEEQNPGHEAAENALAQKRYEEDRNRLLEEHKVTSDKDYIQNLNY